MKLKLKKINHDRFIGFWKAFNERGQNFDAVFKDLNVQASTKNRMMKDLEMIGVTRQSFVLDQPFVNPERDFWKYYDLTMDDLYKKHFYVRIKDSERN